MKNAWQWTILTYNNWTQTCANNAMEISLWHLQLLTLLWSRISHSASPLLLFVPMTWTNVKRVKLAHETLLFRRIVFKSRLIGGGRRFAWLSCKHPALSFTGHTRDAMAGIAQMTGEVMLAYLSAPFSCFSFLSQTRKAAMWPDNYQHSSD